MADRLGLPVAHKPDSQEICFIPDHDYAAFLDRIRDASCRRGILWIWREMCWGGTRAFPIIRWARERD